MGVISVRTTSLAAGNAEDLSRPTPKSAATRAKLITVAERLFAECGIAGVSLNEISRAAHQRHSNVCQYHFGNKDGLIQAIIDKHVPAIAAQRNAIFDEMERTGAAGLADVVHAFVRPVAAKLSDPDGGKEFIRFNAQMVVSHTLAGHVPGPGPFSPPDADRLTRKLEAAMADLGLPQDVVHRRLIMAAIMLFQGLADYSRLRDARPAGYYETELFTRDLEAMIVGALTAPFRRQGEGP
ncbi:MAG: TetR/AcrR family transcriptional regulator [Alphaproteobacteria bacterium]|nr:TetR/AcrR family transcriptional regulator [Alphaproteobacteria bacterium]